MTIPQASRKKHSRSSSTLPAVTLIGYGNWGTALAFALHEANVPLCEIIVRSSAVAARGANTGRRQARLVARLGARRTALANARLQADVFWICTPDTAIAETGNRLAWTLARKPRHKPPIVFHSSGALSSMELAGLRALGASVASVHPLMTFPRRRRDIPDPPPRSLAGVPFAIEGDALACRAARKLVHAMGGDAFTLNARNKALYHAIGMFASPLLVALLTATRDAGVAAGLTPKQAQRRMRPIVERTVMNFFANGPEESFSGPIARGDAATIVRHLRSLSPYPQLLSIYRELARFALTSLPAQNKRQIRQILAGVHDSTGK